MKTVLSVMLALIIVIVGLSIYLAPNDLASCEAQPGYSAPCHPADAVVAISGGDTGARTYEAIRLYENGWAPKLIFSGAAHDKTGPSNAWAMSRQALAAGVPASDILIEEAGETTRQNAEKTQTILAENSISSVIVVTSAYHQRRASLEFKKLAGNIVTIRNHPISSDKHWSMWWWTTPFGWNLATSEFIKIIAFYIGQTR